MPELSYFQSKYVFQILEQVNEGKRPEMLMDTILKLKVEAIVQLHTRVLKLEGRNA